MEPKGEARQQVPRDLPEMFRPPVNRAMRTLDRSFFRKTIPISAASILKASDISQVRSVLHKSRDMLVLPRLSAIRDVSDEDGVTRKALLLREDLKHDGAFGAIVCCEISKRKLSS